MPHATSHEDGTIIDLHTHIGEPASLYIGSFVSTELQKTVGYSLRML